MEGTSQALSRRSRLTSRDGISDILRDRKRMTGHHFELAYRANTLGEARLGLTVSRKLIPQAVKRNAIKRIVREGFRKQRGGVGAVDLVFILKQRQSSRRTLSLEVSHLLSQLVTCQDS